jgi:hypothetical protein
MFNRRRPTGAASCLIAEVFAEVQTLAISEVTK